MKVRENSVEEKKDIEVETEDFYDEDYDDYHSGDNDDDNEDDEHLVTGDHGDIEDTRDEYVSCKDCGGKPYTQEKFERHQQQTGHRGETIRLPKYISP